MHELDMVLWHIKGIAKTQFTITIEKFQQQTALNNLDRTYIVNAYLIHNQ